MRILLLTDDMIIGGVARHVVDMANALSNDGHTVTVAATDGAARPQLHRAIQFVELSLKDNITLRNNYRGSIRSYFLLTSLMRKNRYDVIHSHKRYSHALGKILAFRFGIPLITSYHTIVHTKSNLNVHGEITLCCSEEVKRSIVPSFRGRSDQLKTIHNGVHPFKDYSPAERSKIREQLSIPSGHCVIGSVGQFSAAKNRKDLLTALSELKNRNLLNDVTVLVQGDGPEKDRLVRLRDTYGLGANVQFLSSEFSVESVCNISDFMVLNSLTEGFGLVLIEAASLGKPHIATRVGGIPEIIDDRENGILVDPKDPTALAEAIAELVDNELMRTNIGANAKKKYHGHFTFEIMYKQIRDVYSELLNS